jgi:hypothetical protein
MKRISVALSAGILLFVSQTTSASNAQPGFDPRVSAGFGLAPESLRVRGRDVELVGLGSYIVNGARGCNDCHDQIPSAQLGYRQFRDGLRSSADASAAHSNLGERELRGVYEYWRAMPVQSGGNGRER